MPSVTILVYTELSSFSSKSQNSKKMQSGFLTKKHGKTESSVCFLIASFLPPEKKEKNPIK